MARIKRYASSNAQELGRQIKSDRQLQKLYEQRMSSVEKRVGRIEKNFGKRAVTSNVQKLPKSAEGLSRSELLKGLSQANRYLKSSTSTVKGYRESLRNERESLRDMDLNVTTKELVDVNYFLDEMRAKGYGQIYPSDYIVEMAKSASRAGMTGKQFASVMRNAERRQMDKDDLVANFRYFAENPDLKRFYLKAGRQSSSDDY